MGSVSGAVAGPSSLDAAESRELGSNIIIILILQLFLSYPVCTKGLNSHGQRK